MFILPVLNCQTKIKKMSEAFSMLVSTKKPASTSSNYDYPLIIASRPFAGRSTLVRLLHRRTIASLFIQNNIVPPPTTSPFLMSISGTTPSSSTSLTALTRQESFQSTVIQQCVKVMQSIIKDLRDDSSRDNNKALIYKDLKQNYKQDIQMI